MKKYNLTSILSMIVVSLATIQVVKAQTPVPCYIGENSCMEVYYNCYSNAVERAERGYEQCINSGADEDTCVMQQYFQQQQYELECRNTMNNCFANCTVTRQPTPNDYPTFCHRIIDTGYSIENNRIVGGVGLIGPPNLAYEGVGIFFYANGNFITGEYIGSVYARPYIPYPSTTFSYEFELPIFNSKTRTINSFASIWCGRGTTDFLVPVSSIEITE